MTVRLLTSSDDLAHYDQWVTRHPQGSLWQSCAWKTFQEALGRTVRIYCAEEGEEIVASALVVIDRTTGGLTTWEIPRGPLANDKWKMESGKLMEKIFDDAKHTNALTVFLSPMTDAFSIYHLPFSTSTRHVHPEATRILDLTLNDEDLLAQMKPKGRYNIHLAEKHGVRVAPSTDVQAYASMAQSTAQRDRFRGHSEAFYRAFLGHLPGSFCLLASTASGQPIAGLLGVIWGDRGIYYYGASSNEHRELMAPYLLQWEAMKYCRARGCTSYDLFGIAPEGSLNHPWSGVSDFKAKFGGSVINYPQEQEITLRPFMRSLLRLKRQLLG